MIWHLFFDILTLIFLNIYGLADKTDYIVINLIVHQ